jgi:uncharacterized phage protein (TIGR01671 family)
MKRRGCKMREIKFRVWDKKNKKMYYGYEPDRPNMIDFDGNLCITGTGNIDEYGSPTDYIIGCKQQNYILMQYIGLKDKTGKEIYEGDVVKIRDEEMTFTDVWGDEGQEDDDDWNVVEIGVVRFENGAFIVGERYINEYGWQKGYSIEVIGNIYENPKLLEEIE